MKKRISILFICLIILTACENSETSIEDSKNDETVVSSNEKSSVSKDNSPNESTDEITMDNFQVHGFENIATPEHEWRFEMCETWKKNACIDPESADCKYWEKSDNHMGVTMELCVQAMLITLQQCSQNMAFFDKNPRDCSCVEEQYRKTTHKPDVSKKEGPLFAQECIIEKETEDK